MNRNLSFIAAALLLWGFGEGMFFNFVPIYLDVQFFLSKYEFIYKTIHQHFHLFSHWWCFGLPDVQRNSNLVYDVEQTKFQSAQLDFCSRLDNALHFDGHFFLDGMEERR